MARTPLTALTLWTTLGAVLRERRVRDMQGDALGEGDAGLLDAAVGGEDHGSGGGDAGLGAVAEQAGEPVVGEAGGGGLHEQEVIGGRRRRRRRAASTRGAMVMRSWPIPAAVSAARAGVDHAVGGGEHDSPAGVGLVQPGRGGLRQPVGVVDGQHEVDGGRWSDPMNDAMQAHQMGELDIGVDPAALEMLGDRGRLDRDTRRAWPRPRRPSTWRGRASGRGSGGRGRSRSVRSMSRSTKS